MIREDDRKILGYEFDYVREAIRILRGESLDNVSDNLARLEKRLQTLSESVQRVIEQEEAETASKLLAALNEIARQHTSAEWDEDADGEPSGDVTEGYDGIIQFAREAVK